MELHFTILGNGDILSEQLLKKKKKSLQEEESFTFAYSVYCRGGGLSEYLINNPISISIIESIDLFEIFFF